MFKSLGNLCKKEAFERFCTVEMNNDPYKSLKRMAASQSSNDVPVELVINGQSITKEEVIVKELCKSFFPRTKNIGPTQENTINHYKSYLKNSPKTETPTISQTELKNSIFALNDKAAPGIDGIGLDLIQPSYSIIANTLLKLYNKCLELNHYPKIWKVAKVTVLKNPIRLHTRILKALDSLVC